jgi:hypothetical protein
MGVRDPARDPGVTMAYLAALLDAPVLALPQRRRPEKHVYHLGIRVAPEDRRLTDEEWAQIAREILDASGLAPAGDPRGVRWVAVRHADDHIHVVVTLARQDGRAARASNDFYRVGQTCRDAERRLGLTRTAPRDRTAAHRPTRAESEKAARHRRGETPRARLQREVRTAAAGAASADEFVATLQRGGLLVRVRHSDRSPGVVTGYAVALPGDRTRQGLPVWFGGGRLAADLTWPKLATRWPGAAGRSATTAGHGLSPQDRSRLWRQASDDATRAAGDLRRLAVTDPAAGSDLAYATADVLSVTARLVEGRHGGPLTAAADAFDRAGRDLHGRPTPHTPAGSGLRATARLLALAGRASHDETAQVLALVAELAALSDAVAQLRHAQGRAAQAAAARDAAEGLRRLSRTTPDAPPRPPREAVVHMSRLGTPPHKPSAAAVITPPTRRKVSR